MNDEERYDGESQDEREPSAFPPPLDDVEDGGQGDDYYSDGDYSVDEPPMPSWEQREEVGFWPALFSTIREVALEPARTFRRMPITGGIGGPLVFLLIPGSIGCSVGAIWSIIFQLLSASGSGDPDSAFISMAVYMVIALLSPVWVAIGAFISSGITHVCLMLVGAEPREFEATFRVYCYTSGALSLLLVIPMCGDVALVVWYIVCATFGLREAHNTTTGRALVALLLPTIVCCLCCAMGIAVMGGFFVVGA